MTGSYVEESLLESADQGFQGLGRSGPEYEAVPLVFEVGMLGLVDELVEDGVEAEAGEAGGEESGFLLAVACGSVGFVAGLDLFLGVVRREREGRRWLTGSFWQDWMRES